MSDEKKVMEVGQPNYTPMPGNVAWEHPRVESASNELMAAADDFAFEKKQFPATTSLEQWSKACNRLENAAIAFANAVREYTL